MIHLSPLLSACVKGLLWLNPSRHTVNGTGRIGRLISEGSPNAALPSYAASQSQEAMAPATLRGDGLRRQPQGDETGTYSRPTRQRRMERGIAYRARALW